MKISSPAFEHEQIIPDRYAREKENKNPPLAISGVPEEAKSVVLIMEDPDAPSGTFTHWVVFNLDPRTSVIVEGTLPRGASQGKNDYGEIGYGGPRPPSGTHRYFFHVYALDCRLELPNGVARPDLERALETHVVGSAVFMGKYSAQPEAIRR